METGGVSAADPGTTGKLCVFCRRPGQLTNEHLIPWWLESGEKSNEAVFIHAAGGPDYEPWRHARRGTPRDLQAKAPCAECNNGWMNDMDGALSVLGPQLVRGKPVRLTKGKKVALSAWSVKFALMSQLVYPRDSRFVIPDADYPQFSAERKLSELDPAVGRVHRTPVSMAVRPWPCTTTGTTRCHSTLRCCRIWVLILRWHPRATSSLSASVTV